MFLVCEKLFIVIFNNISNHVGSIICMYLHSFAEYNIYIKRYKCSTRTKFEVFFQVPRLDIK